ncbi:hypothetical protein TNCV_3871331 [Trichonephila clavipes]|nr:hypothetical protein TNCV_3871331 [Trichonephila clavipes]
MITGPELCSFPAIILPLFWRSTGYLGCSQWVGCPAEGTSITHIQVLQKTTQSSQCLNEGPFSFGSLLLQVVTVHVSRFKTSKRCEARNVQGLIIRKHLGQKLHNTPFSFGLEVSDLGGSKPLKDGLPGIWPGIIEMFVQPPYLITWGDWLLSPAFRLESSRKWLLIGSFYWLPATPYTPLCVIRRGVGMREVTSTSFTKNSSKSQQVFQKVSPHVDFPQEPSPPKMSWIDLTHGLHLFDKVLEPFSDQD